MEIKQKIIECTQEIFTSMIMMDISVSDETPQIPKVLHDNISGMIGLGGTHKGILGIHLPYVVAMAITSSFLGMEVTEIGEDVEDAVGELANMLGGNVKTILSEKGRDIELSLPSTIHGKEYGVQTSHDTENVVISFACEVGNFIVQLQLEK